MHGGMGAHMCTCEKMNERVEVAPEHVGTISLDHEDVEGIDMGEPFSTDGVVVKLKWHPHHVTGLSPVWSELTGGEFCSIPLHYSLPRDPKNMRPENQALLYNPLVGQCLGADHAEQ